MKKNDLMKSDEQFLKHYGIRGMKWGRRRSRKQLAKEAAKRNGKKPEDDYEKSEDHKKSRSLKRKHLSELSNTELKELNNRLQMERQYKQLTKVEKSKGRKIFDEIVVNSGKEIATNYAKTKFKQILGEDDNSIDAIVRRATKDAHKEMVTDYVKKAVKNNTNPQDLIRKGMKKKK